MPSLTSAEVAGENNEINYNIISFSSIRGNCSVQSPSHSTLFFQIPTCLWSHKCLAEHVCNINETNDKYLFRFLRPTQIVEQSSHTSCRPEFPRDTFAFRCCHGMATSPCELSCTAAPTSHEQFVQSLIKEH